MKTGVRASRLLPVSVAAESLRSAGRFSLFTFRVLAAVWRAPHYPREAALHLSRVCRRCVLPVIAVVAPVGMLLALQGVALLRSYGTEFMVSGLISVALLRELCPAMTGIMMAAQAGSGMAAELGSMRIKEELDATEVIGVDPFKYLVIPRVLAGTVACPIVNIIAFATGIAGGYVVAVLGRGISPGAFAQHLFRFVDPTDIAFSTIKAVMFGMILSLVSCYKGFTVVGGAAEVGKGANMAVVLSIVLYLVVNYVFTTFFFLVKPWFGY